MQPSEFVMLQAQLGETINAQLANWLTILSIYLGAGYLVAHRMKLHSAILVTVIAVLPLAGFALQIASILRVWTATIREIKALGQPGDPLAWHPAAQTPDWFVNYFPANSLVLMFVVIAAAMYFFFSMRAEQLRLEKRDGA